MTPTTTTVPTKRKPGRPRKHDTPDVGQTIRLPAPVREGLALMAQQRRTSVSDVVRDYLPGMDWYATEDGQHALVKLQQAVALSTTIHKSLQEFATLIGEPDEWNTLPVMRYGAVANDSATLPRFVHVVRQQEHQTRNEATADYAQRLWALLSNIKNEHERTTALNELCNDDRHAYVVGFVGLRSWHVFPSPLELNAYELNNPRPDGVTPTTADELRVYNHFAEWFGVRVAELNNAEPGRHVLYSGSRDLTTAFEAMRANDTRPGETDNNEDDPGLLVLLNANGTRSVWSSDGSDELWFELRWFPDENANDSAQRWARQMVARYVEFASAYSDANNATPARFIRVTGACGYAVTVLRWLTTGRKMKT